ncbi:hypothetical protein [Halalkalibacter akibai]|uniref:Type II secretion system protein n=1 Tax=Halalkalibacter akibai (strain ATCC 43226 / DSM 21942 / CIP 109018 / JCM 9157 / 1139) TaxID=1236973 RepID=W4QWL1_HALA3|nr:hypothetical protein [Halalkalibacter akibai]GAE36297.1 hypothetical protein JCM9157_3458 [Halalkalibacter akibai JCM 9157]
MASLILLTIFSATILPLISIIYVERIAVREELNALTELEETLHDYLQDREHSQSQDSKDHMLITREYIKSGVIKICIQRKGGNNRINEKCLLAAK